MAANCRSAILTLLAWVAFEGLASSQIRSLTLEQAGSRAGPGLAPAYEGEELAVAGQVSSRPLWSWDSYVIPIQDSAGFGLTLNGSALQIESFAPGDWIQVRGVIAGHAGLPLLSIRDIQKFQTSPPPVPASVTVAALNSGRYAGVLVTTQGVVTQSSENSSGDLLTIGQRPELLEIFLPKTRKNGSRGLNSFHSGDRVRATGIGSQYCATPPYDHGYRVLLADVSGVVLLGKTGSSSSGLLLASVLFIAGLLIVWWIRERRMASQRHQLRVTNQLMEEVIAATSATEILSKLNTVLPKISKGSRVSLYLYHRGSKWLESVPSLQQPGQLTIRPEAPEGPIATGVALCLRNRTLLAVPDAKRSPFFKTNGQKDLPLSVMFVPMFARSELLGVMELAYPQQEHNFGHEEEAAMQHLGNQVATALRLQDQKSIREQLFRSERLAAGAQLISGVAAELNAPLSAILDLLGILQKRRSVGYSSELETIRSEAERASEIVARLVSFGKIGQMEAQPVDLNALLLALVRFRSQDRKRKGLEILPQILTQPVMVLGSQGQLEQVFLNLLVHVEQVAAEARNTAMSISTSLLANRLVVEIGYQGQLGEAGKSDPFSDGESGGVLGLGLCRAIIQSHGGEIQLVRVSATQSRFEVELPVMEDSPFQLGGVEPATRTGQCQLTFLAVEPDAASRKQWLDLLSKRGHRVVPVTNAEEAAELAHRLKFDAAVCSTRLTGLNWADFYERVRHHVDSFILVTDSYDAELAKAFQSGNGFVLSRPLDTQHLSRILTVIEERSSQVAGG